MHSFHTSIPCIYSIHLFHTFISCIYSIHLFHTSIPYIYFMHFFKCLGWFDSRDILMIALVWLLGIGIAFPQLIVGEAEEFQYGEKVYLDCKEKWSSGGSGGEIYSMVVFVVTFALPMLAITFFYGSI